MSDREIDPNSHHLAGAQAPSGGSALCVEDDVPESFADSCVAGHRVAVDTECQGLRLWRDQLCLAQLCDDSGRIVLVRLRPPNPPPRLAQLLENPSVIKVFHYALSDVSFLRTSLNLRSTPFHCTKVMSKIVRTYTERHGLRDLVREFTGHELRKEQQSSNWGGRLSPEQLVYAANDVRYLLSVYDGLHGMLAARGRLPGGSSAEELNAMAQQALPAMVELLVSGYATESDRWRSFVYNH